MTRIVKRQHEGAPYRTLVGQDGRTKKEFQDECDINKIMAKWNRTGLVDHLAKTLPAYGDFTNAMDFQAAKNALISAENAFASLPAHVRSRMSNDPGKLLDFLGDPANEDEARSLGLIPKASPQKPPASPEPPQPPAGEPIIPPAVEE